MSDLYAHREALIEHDPHVALIVAVLDRAVRDYKSSDPVKATDALIWLLTAGPRWLDLAGLNVNPDFFLNKVVTL